MPLRLPDKLPAIKMLEDENIFVIDETRGHSQDIRPLKLVILNLMPLKITTETDLIRLLSNTPLQIDVTFMKLKSHTSKNMPYEEVTYWPEIQEIFAWAKTHVTSTLYICWAAQAALYAFHGIDKIRLPKKLFGIFPQDITLEYHDIPLFRGFDTFFNMPHSRHAGTDIADVRTCSDISILAASEKTGPSIMMERDGREIYITGHMEYNPETLDTEYRRDLGKRDDVEKPINYYKNDDPDQGPLVTWRAHANLFFHNWINYYVYQKTPYNIDEIN